MYMIIYCPINIDQAVGALGDELSAIILPLIEFTCDFFSLKLLFIA